MNRYMQVFWNVLVIGLALFYTLGCGTQERSTDNNESVATSSLSMSSFTASSSSASSVMSDFAPWYETMRNDVITMSVRTVIEPGTCTVDDYSGCTLEDVNNDLDADDNFEPEIRVHVSADDLPDDALLSNATLQIMGTSTRLTKQKSYRIKLDDDTKGWQQQQVIQLHKHPYDLSRLRNYLSFQLFKSIEHISSLRVQLVHLYVDDEDYGLFTHVENVDKSYLQNRHFNENDNLYKAHAFFFNLSAGLQLGSDGSSANQELLDLAIEPKNGDELFRLVEMVHAINNANNDFKSVFEKYFNRDNYLTWMAINILMDNKDTMAQNFYLYNPAGSNTFYFMPSDYDTAWGFWLQPQNQNTNVPLWKEGIGAWWGSPLHQKFLSDPKNREDLKKAVHDIREKYLSELAVNEYLKAAKELVYPLIEAKPDSENLPIQLEDIHERMEAWEKEILELYARSLMSEEGFYKSLQRPLPFWVDVTYESNRLIVSWSVSVDLQKESVHYSLKVGTSPSFETKTLLIEKDDITATALFSQMTLESGTYYVQVLSYDASGNMQQAFDSYRDDAGVTYPGVYEFTIP